VDPYCSSYITNRVIAPNFIPVKTSCHYMYRTLVYICTAKFKIHKFYVVPKKCSYVFFVDLRTNSYYLLIQHYHIGFNN